MDRNELSQLLGREPVPSERETKVVCERDPDAFRAAFADAVAGAGPVVLADPEWGGAEKDQFQSVLQQPLPETATGQGWLAIPTGGSAGTIKLARHDEATLAAAVQGFTSHFQVETVRHLGVLPLHHVSGLLAWMRCVLTAGRYEPWSWKRLEAGDRPALGKGDWFLSLVPTQLERLLKDAAAVEWLRQFRAVFLGGGPTWPELLERAAAAQLSISLTYGMTETAAMVTALPPEQFLAGQRGCGAPLAHAQVTVGAESEIIVEAPSLFRGYWPELRSSGPWATGDLGVVDEHGSLHVLGRRDAIIISGGEKIDPSEVERVLRRSGAFTDLAVLGLPDPQWGQVVVACHPVESGPVQREQIERTLDGQLAPYKWPKRYVPVEPWPRNEQGKVNRGALTERLTGG